MQASELRLLVLAVRAEHSPRHDVNDCQICTLLVAIDTAVVRHWDPISGKSLCARGHKHG